jgi:hypothetical protein
VEESKHRTEHIDSRREGKKKEGEREKAKREKKGEKK